MLHARGNAAGAAVVDISFVTTGVGPARREMREGGHAMTLPWRFARVIVACLAAVLTAGAAGGQTQPAAAPAPAGAVPAAAGAGPTTLPDAAPAAAPLAPAGAAPAPAAAPLRPEQLEQ